MVSKVTRNEFRKNIAEYARQFQLFVETSVAGFDPDPQARAKRLKKAETDFWFFARTYFPHYIRGKTGGPANGTDPIPPSAFHRWLFKNLPAVLDKPESSTLALAAPRGESKSTYVSLIFLIWCLAYRRKRYAVLIMDTYEQAAVHLEAIKAELERNPRLGVDFPDLTGKGRVWNEGVIVTRTSLKVHARGGGQKVRGLKHGPYRPDLVVLDDIENDENVQNPKQRDKLQGWLNKAVENLGEAGEKTDILYVGTILHYDSVLVRTQANPLWQSVTFYAINRWPDNMTLWDRWEEILHNDGERAADLFYQKNRMTMEAGAEVSWPEKRPLYFLMKTRFRVGHDAFDSEFQNDPVSGDRTFTELTFWVERLSDWLFFGACDPSLGKRGEGRDPSAILVGGFSMETGILDVVEADIRKRVPDIIISDVISFQRQYRCLQWAIESVQFQEFFRTTLVNRSAREEYATPVPAVPYVSSVDKDLRIAAIQPHTVNGLIRVNPNHKTLISQLKHWPKADHDDGPDALAMLWWVATNFGHPSQITSSGKRRATSQLGSFIGG